MTSGSRGRGSEWLRVVGATAGVELRRWRRQRVAVASALLLPVAMAVLVSLALGDDLGEFSTSFAFVDGDQGPAGAAFEDQVFGSPAVRDMVAVREVETEDEARRLLDRGDVAAAIVLPDGLTQTLTDGDGPWIEVLRDHDEPIAGDLAALLVNQYEIRGQETVVAVERVGAVPAEPWPLEVAVTAPGGRQLDAATHYGPSLGLFFLLVTMGFAASRLVADRRRGVVERVAAGPAALSAVLTGRAVAALAVGGLSMAVLALTAQLVFGRSWGPPGPLAAVTAAVVVAMAGVAALLAALARTAEQAQALSIGVAFLFALASGSFAPPGAALRPAFAELAPTTHALDAYATLTTERAGLAAVGSSLVALLAFGAVGLLLTPVLVRRLG